jgi:hypothetical protein
MRTEIKHALCRFTCPVRMLECVCVCVCLRARARVCGFCSPEYAAKVNGFRINQHKTQHMYISARGLLESPNFEIEAYTFEQVHTLTYLSTKINKELM